MAKEKFSIVFGIQAELFSLVLIGFSLLIAITAWSIGHEAETVASAAIDKALERSRVSIETKLASRYSSINETAKNLARDGRILPSVFDGDRATLQDLSSEFQKSLDFDILFFTDGQGTILARSDRPEAVGSSVAGRSALFDSALEGNAAEGVIVSRGKLLQIVAVPILDNVAKDIVRGTVALAYEVSPMMAEELNKLTASQIGLFVFQRNANREVDAAKSIHLTHPKMQAPLDQYWLDSPEIWQSILALDHGEKELSFEVEGEEFHAVAIPLARSGGGNLGFILAMRSRTELLHPFFEIQQQVITVGVVGLLIACLIAWFIAYRISRPIIKLVTITKSIEEGNYPRHVKLQRRRDEVGVLFNAVLSMGRSLKEKADLENYLAQLADDLDEGVASFESDSLAAAEAVFAMDVKDDTAQPVVQDPDVTLTRHPASEPPAATPAKPAATGRGLAVDTVINNRYVILRLLGTGAAGQVYLAQDNELNEHIALKILNPDTFDQAETDQFKEEIRLARRITHRNILRTFDFGRWEGSHYITMEHVHGHDLSELIQKKGAMDIHIGVLMARQICSALGAAHEQGIIHRDLKPSNMMVNRQGILKIMDFGLAMQIQTPESVKDADLATTISGTPNFMAPEQFLRQPLDQRSDIYAIGIILYIIFTGKPPFKARDVEGYARCHLSEIPPDLRDTVPSAPERLQDIIHKCLEKDMGDRYASVKTLMDDLQKI